MTDTGPGRDRLVADALGVFPACLVMPEADAAEDEERAFADAHEAVARGEYAILDDPLGDRDGHRHAPG